MLNFVEPETRHALFLPTTVLLRSCCLSVYCVYVPYPDSLRIQLQPASIGGTSRPAHLAKSIEHAQSDRERGKQSQCMDDMRGPAVSADDCWPGFACSVSIRAATCRVQRVTAHLSGSRTQLQQPIPGAAHLACTPPAATGCRQLPVQHSAVAAGRLQFQERSDTLGWWAGHGRVLQHSRCSGGYRQHRSQSSGLVSTCMLNVCRAQHV